MPSFAVQLRQTTEQMATVHVDAPDPEAAETMALAQSDSAEFRSFFLVTAPEVHRIEPA